MYLPTWALTLVLILMFFSGTCFGIELSHAMTMPKWFFESWR